MRSWKFTGGEAQGPPKGQMYIYILEYKYEYQMHNQSSSVRKIDSRIESCKLNLHERSRTVNKRVICGPEGSRNGQIETGSLYHDESGI